MITLFKSVSASISTNTQTHPLTALLLEGISGLQTIYLLLITIFPASVNRAFRFTELLKQVTSIFATGEILGPGSFSSSAVEVICYSLIGYLIVLGLFIIILFIRSSSQTSQTENNSLASLISKALRIHSRVIFFIAQYYFLKYLTNSSDQEIPSNEITWRWWLIVGYVANIFITVLYETCFCQRAKIKDSYAAHIPLFHQLVIAHKLFGLTVYFLVSSLAQDKMETVAAVVHIVFTVAARAALSVFLPFYSAKLMKESIAFTSFQFSLAIVLVMKACNLKQEVLEALCMVLPPLVVKILLTVLRWRFERILRVKPQTPQEAMHFAGLLKKLAFGPAHPSRHLRKVPKDSLVSTGLLSKYGIDIAKGILIDTEKEYKQLVYLYILQVMEGVSMKHPNSVALSLYMAKIYLKRLNNESQALKVIMKIQTKDLSLAENNSLKTFHKLMEELKQHHNQTQINTFDRHHKGEKEDVDIHNIDIQSYFRAQEFVDLIRKDMYQEVSNHLSFWQALKSDQLDVRMMFDLCQRIESLSIKLRKHYAEDLSHLQNYCCATIIMFAVYLHLIREIPEDSSLTKRFLRYLKDSSLRHALDIYSSDVAVIVNSSQGSSGVILSASGSLQTILKIEGSRLIGKSIDYIFPSVFAKQYMDYLYEYTKSLASSDSENKFKTFAKTASGHLFEVEVFFKVYPEISQEMKIMGLLKVVPSSHHLILLGHDGSIIDCDAQIAKDLNIMTSDIGRLNIHKICSSFNIINKAFNSVYSNEWELGSRGTKRNQSQGLEIVQAASSLTQKFPTDALMSPKYPDNHPLISPKSPTETMPMMMMTHPNTETVINFKTIVPTQHDDTLRTEQSERHQTLKAGFDKSKEICEGYMKGKKLSFFEYNKETEDKGGLKETEYDVKIEPHVLDGKVYKLLRLENAQLVKEKLTLSEVAKSVTLKLKNQRTFQQFSERRSSQASSIGSHSQNQHRNPIIEVVENEKKESAAALVTRLQRTLLSSLGYREAEEPEAPNELEIFPEMLPPEIAINKEGIVRRQQDVIDSSLDPSRASQDQVVLGHKVQQSQISSMHSSMISAKSARGRIMRALHQVLDANRSYFVSFRALVVLYLIISGLLGLAIANYTYSLSSINQVQEELNANNLLNVRLCAAMSGWSSLVRLYTRSIGWRTDTQQGIQRFQGNILLFAGNMNSDNNNLQRLLASAKTKALFNRMLKRDITFALNMTNETSEVGPMNSFIATDLLVNKYYEASRLSYSDFYTAEGAEVIANAIQNGGNDYLASSEKIMEETKEMLSSVSSQSVLVLKLILIFVFVALVVFLLAYLIILNNIVLKLQKLFQAIIRIEQHSIDKKILRFEQVKDLFEEDIQTDLSIANASNLLYQRRPRDKKQHEKLLRSSHKNIQTRSLVKLLAAYLLVAIILIMVLCGLFVEGLTNTINNFHSMDTINNQLSVLSKAQYQASALGGLLFLDIMYWNSTSTFTFKRQSLKSQMLTTLSFFSGVNDDIKGAFSTEENDQVIEDLLYHKICGHLTASMTTTQCWAGTLNDTMNIQTLNTYFYTSSLYYYNLFLASQTVDTGKAIFLVFYKTLLNYINTLDQAYTFLISHIVGNVNTTVDDFKSMKLVRFSIILLVILTCIVVIQNVTVKAFARYDKGRGSILKIMGMDIVLESKALIYYLKSEFDKKGTILGSNALK